VNTKVGRLMPVLACFIFLLLSGQAMATDNYLMTPNNMLSSECLNASTVHYYGTITINGTDTPFSYEQNCIAGCTSGTCRPDTSVQTIYSIGILLLLLFVCIAAGKLSDSMPYADTAIYAIVALCAVMIVSYVDLVSSLFRGLFIAFILLPIGLLIYSMIGHHGGHDDD
jgi:hypothetical protein